MACWWTLPSNAPPAVSGSGSRCNGTAVLTLEPGSKGAPRDSGTTRGRAHVSPVGRQKMARIKASGGGLHVLHHRQRRFDIHDAHLRAVRQRRRAIDNAEQLAHVAGEAVVGKALQRGLGQMALTKL